MPHLLWRVQLWITPKISVILKNSSNKSRWALNCVQKSPREQPGVELMGSKDQYVWNLIMYRNVHLDSLYGLTLPKICMISKEASNKSCSELNFVQKSSGCIMSISPRSGVRGSKDQDVWYLKPSLHLHANANNACGREARQNVWYIRTLFGIRWGSELTIRKCTVCEFLVVYRQSTDSILLLAKHSSHSQMLFASAR